MVEESEELLLEEITTEILNDLILEFCFEVHREIKLGYMELYYESGNNKHYQESKSLEGNLFCPNKAGGDQENKFSNQQERIYPKKVNDLKVTAKGNMLLETHISMKSINIVNPVPVYSEENNERTYYYENSDRTKKFKIKHFVMKPSYSSTLNNEVCNLNNFKNGVHNTHNFQESKIFSGVMNESVSKGNGSVTGLGILRSNGEHLKLLTEGVAQVSSLVHHKDLTKSSECHSDYKSLPLENEWIEEVFHCSECKNSKSFKDWMQFIAPTETGEKKTRMERTAKESSVDKEMNDSLLSDKEQGDVDIFGNREKSLKNTISKSTCMCPLCHRKVGAARFACHLSTCMGLGRRRSTRMYSVAK